MAHNAKLLILAAAAGLWLSGAALAQTSADQPSAHAVADQFKSGVNRVGTGFGQVGEGLKQGAILTWNAIVDGATTTASHFNGSTPPVRSGQQPQ